MNSNTDKNDDQKSSEPDNLEQFELVYQVSRKSSSKEENWEEIKKTESSSSSKKSECQETENELVHVKPSSKGQIVSQSDINNVESEDVKNEAEGGEEMAKIKGKEKEDLGLGVPIEKQLLSKSGTVRTNSDPGIEEFQTNNKEQSFEKVDLVQNPPESEPKEEKLEKNEREETKELIQSNSKKFKQSTSKEKNDVQSANSEKFALPLKSKPTESSENSKKSQNTILKSDQSSSRPSTDRRHQTRFRRISITKKYEGSDVPSLKKDSPKKGKTMRRSQEKINLLDGHLTESLRSIQRQKSKGSNSDSSMMNLREDIEPISKLKNQHSVIKKSKVFDENKNSNEYQKIENSGIQGGVFFNNLSKKFCFT